MKDLTVEKRQIEQILNTYNLDELEKLGLYLASDNVHRTLQQNFMRLVKAFIMGQNYKEKHQYDKRNADTVNMCKRISSDILEDPLLRTV